MGLEVTGFEGALDRLRQLSNSAAVDAALRKGIAQVAHQIQGTAKQLCPVGNPETDPNSGQLRNSITVTPLPNGSDVGSDLDYAPYVEYGTGQKGAPSVAHNPEWVGMRPQPYLYPAAKVHEETAPTILIEAIKEETKKW